MTCQNGTSKPDPSMSHLKEELKAAIRMLPPREREVLIMRLALEGNVPWSLGELSLYFNVPQKTVRRLETKALRRLRHPIVGQLPDERLSQ